MKKFFDPGARNEQVASGAANAKFLAHNVQGGFGQTQEVTKFPGAQAVILTADMSAVRNGSLNDGVQLESADGGEIVNFV